MPQARTGPAFRGNLALPALEERREVFQRTCKLPRAGRLSVRVLRLQETIERGDERARDVVCLKTHERARVRIRLRGEEGLSCRTLCEAVSRTKS
jgi:hypothetical protein